MRRKKPTQPKFKIGWTVQVYQEPKHLNSMPTWRPIMDIFKGQVGYILYYKQLEDLTWAYQIKTEKKDLGLYSEAFLFREEWLVEHTGDLISNEQRRIREFRDRFESVYEKEEK